MRTLEERIILIDNEREIRDNKISIMKEDSLTYRVYSKTIDKEWTTFPQKRLQKIARGLVQVCDSYCTIKGNIIDAIMLASVLRIGL